MEITYNQGIPQINHGNGEVQVLSYDIAGRIKREERQKHIDYLISQVDSGLFPVNKEQAEAIFEAFSSEVSAYINVGSNSFYTAIQNETGTSIATTLDTVANPANGFTIRQSILFELDK